jgi:outer membrane protein
VKNLSLLLNVVLVIAVAILFYLQFSSPKAVTADSGNGGTPGDTSSTAGATAGRAKKESRNYFVNMDTLNEQYKLLQDVGRELRAKKNALESQYQANVQKYQEDLMVYQQKLQENKITADEAQRTEDNLRKLGEKIQGAERNLEYLMEELDKKNMDARKELDEFLDEYKKGKNIDYIFGYSSVIQTIVYGNDSLDITREVLKGLNERYEQKKAQGPPNPKKK